MRQISLRRFREEVADLTQQVEVSKRDPAGNIRVLGYWTPYMTHPENATVLPEPDGDELPEATVTVLDGGTGEVIARPTPRIIKTPEEAAAAVQPVRPFSKADQARRGKRK